MIALEKLNVNLKKSWMFEKSTRSYDNLLADGSNISPFPSSPIRFRFCVVNIITFNQFKYCISLDLYIVVLIPF